MIFNLTTPAVSKLPKFTYTGTYELIEDGEKDWRIKFLTGGVLTPKRKMKIDVFLVGGGAAGGVSYGGGGGYTTTQKDITLVTNTQYDITIGAGGTGGNNSPGGDSTAFGIAAAGASGKDGGSGGGQCYIAHDNDYSGGNGGSDGSNGGTYNPASTRLAAQGQGTTTREFGEPTGELYAGGGGGAGHNGNHKGLGGAGGGGDGQGYYTPNASDPIAGETNKGGGGGGVQTLGSTAADGGSGIVIIRNHREVAV